MTKFKLGNEVKKKGVKFEEQNLRNTCRKNPKEWRKNEFSIITKERYWRKRRTAR